MKKSFWNFLCVMLCAVLTAGCASAPKAAGTDRLRVVTTIFPEYDWVKRIAGDRAEITLLLDNGVDLHSYQPTADDIVTLSTCDMFVYVGGESDEWVKDALKEAVNERMVVINLLETLGDLAKEEEIVEGMQLPEEEEEEEAYDEHVWLSLRNAGVLCRGIADALCSLDPDHSALYNANAEAYLEELNALDAAYRTATESAPCKTLLFADRFPFLYLAQDYGLSYYAAFAGCSAETEASFETIVFLANQVDALGLKAILQIESADGSMARTVRQATKSKDQAILTMDSMQSVTLRDAESGVTYLSVMEKNLGVLKDALQ